MSDTSTAVSIIVTSGLAASAASVLTAVVQGFMKRGESRALAADQLTHAAGNLAERLDKTVASLLAENAEIRGAFIALIEVMETEMDQDSAASTGRIRAALRAARKVVL